MEIEQHHGESVGFRRQTFNSSVCLPDWGKRRNLNEGTVFYGNVKISFSQDNIPSCCFFFLLKIGICSSLSIAQGK